MTHYLSIILKDVLAVLLSLELIGSPSSFINDVILGSAELYNKPKKGFSVGFIEGLGGIGIGCWAFFKSVLAGVFNSLASINSAIAGFLSYLSFDDTFIICRAYYMVKKARNVFIGIYLGIVLFLIGIFFGIFGLIKVPATVG